MKKGMIILGFALLNMFNNLLVMAGGVVEMSTSINDIHILGDKERAGSITFSVRSNAYAGASIANPVYTRISFPDGVVLCDTLVDQQGPSETSGPIYLGMALSGFHPDLALNADPHTASIVRWVAGERHIWVRVDTDSSTWITDVPRGVSTAPAADRPVEWILGISARHMMQALENEDSNLPFNTRNASAGPDDLEDAVSTLLCWDMSEYQGEVDDIQRFSLIFYDQTADKGNGLFGAGNPAAICPTWDTTIARTKERACTVLGAPVPQAPVVTRGVLASATHEYNLTLNCQSGGTHLQTSLLDGATIRLSTHGRTDLGFHPLDTHELMGVSSFTIFEDPIQVDGETLYQTLDIVWANGSQSLVNYDLAVQTTVRWLDEGPTPQIDLGWKVLLANHDGAQDTAPFDGPQQNRRCEPSFFLAGNGLWTFEGVANTPFFTAQPAQLTTADVGERVVLTAQALNAVSYQWRKNGVDLPGQIATELVLEAVSTTDAGSYDCVAVNGSQVTSTPAILVVD